mmetsp:Transcript_10420/g.22055  ORF Transcript_10420/g.22055 Transcript_10420/m.22055 type:complete len:286 (+) Transcript_10420:278-1135(+)
MESSSFSCCRRSQAPCSASAAALVFASCCKSSDQTPRAWWRGPLASKPSSSSPTSSGKAPTPRASRLALLALLALLARRPEAAACAVVSSSSASISCLTVSAKFISSRSSASIWPREVISRSSIAASSAVVACAREKEERSVSSCACKASWDSSRGMSWGGPLQLDRFRGTALSAPSQICSTVPTVALLCFRPLRFDCAPGVGASALLDSLHVAACSSTSSACRRPCKSEASCSFCANSAWVPPTSAAWRSKSETRSAAAAAPSATIASKRFLSCNASPMRTRSA